MDKGFGSGGSLSKLIQETDQKNQQFQVQQESQVKYPNPSQKIEDQINALPNSEKLSGFERWVYKKLPGVADSSIGKLLESFGSSPVGKALNVLDVFAEGAERTLGLISQARYMKPGEDFSLKDAWNAGSLYYDVSNLPTFSNGNLQIESDLPGTYALVEARKLMQQGASLDEVRNTLYNNLGALKIRSQLQDTFGHVAIDPLNFIGGAIKPVEKLTAMRNLALAGKVDVAAAEKIAQGLRDAGRIEDAIKVENALSDAQKAGKVLTRTDKAVINLFGGAAYLEDDSKLGKLFGSKLNPLALTPEAKAHELIDMAEKNVTAYLINNSSTPEEFMRNMEAVAKGSIGGEWGHIALTPQGRVVQGMFNHADASVKALGREWQLYTDERNALEVVSRGLGKKTDDIWKMAKQNPEELGRLISKASQDGVLAVTNPKVVEAIGNIPSGVVSREKFFANASALIEDSAAKIGIAKFGVSEKKFITKLSDAVKKYETLAFIRANPANAVRNKINNEVTLVARGLYGTPFSSVNKYWEAQLGENWKDLIPQMFRRGFNTAGDGMEEEFDLAAKTLSKALNGEGDRSWVSKAGDLADNIKLEIGGKSLSTLSQEAEAGASLRATTNAYIEFGSNYWNTKTGFTSIQKYLPADVVDQLNAIDPNLARTLDDVAEASGGNAKKFKELMQAQLETNSASVVKAVEDNLGYKVGDVLGPEITAQITEGLPKATAEGKVPEFIAGLRAQMEDHVDQMFNKHIENLPGITANYVQAGGPTQFSRIFSKAMDELWAGNTEHAIRMSTINELIDYAKQTGDYKKVGSLWGKIFEDSENHFNRVWKKMDAYEQGMKEGARLAGIPYPPELADSFKNMKGNWKEFYDFRNAEYKAFFDARNSGQKTAKEWEQVIADVDKKFRTVSAQEDKYYAQIDDALAEMIPDKELRKMYTRARDYVGQLRDADRKATEQFYQQLRKADAGEQPDMWQKFWKDRTQRIAEIRDAERRASAAMQGDANAIQQFAAGSPATADANTVQGLASQYDIATQTSNGVRMDNRLRNMLKKYGDFTPEDIINSAQLPDEVKTAFSEYNKVVENLNAVEAQVKGVDIANVTPEMNAQLKAAKQAEKDARKAYDAVLEKNKIDKKMINKLIKSGEPMDVNKLPLDKVKAAFEKRAAEKATGVKKTVDKYFLPDAEKMWPEQPPIETAISELNYGRSYAVMDNLVEEAQAQAKVKMHKIADLPEELQAKVMKWADNVSSETTAFQSARLEYAKMRRDSALLNYTRRNNFDNFLGHIAPFAFWTTHSMANWAIHSLDRPAMLTSYLRYQKLLETSGLENDKLPSRMRGHLRVNLPFAPDWMGEQFVNPVGVALPFDAWQQPWEQANASAISNENRALRTLDDMLEKGVITDQQYEEAKNTKSGDAWDMAMSKAQEGGDNYDAMDFAQAMMTPHAPLLWAYNAARGTPNEIGPFTPISKTVKNVATMFGVKDWANSPYNVEGRVRKELGLPAFDKWDDYRVGREISNLAADGTFSMDEIQNAMTLAAQVEAGQISSKEAVAKSKVYEEATYRANQESAGGWAGTILGALGIPVKSFPTGEEKQRELANEFGKAMEASKNGNEDALTKFFDDNPEFEARLALFKKPEERLKNFMIDNMWSRWNELPKVTQQEVKDQLGSSFADDFMNKDTRNYDAITPQQLQIWLKLTGGKNIGELSATENAMLELNQLKLTDPATAWRVQSFYDMRDNAYPDWYEMQSDYYDLPQGAARSKFAAENPELKAYWNDRAKWMKTNPDLVRFLTDDPKQLKKYENIKRNPQFAVPTAQELSSQISPENAELIQQWQGGQTLPPSTANMLDNLARQYGISRRALLGILSGQSGIPVQ